MSAPTLLDLMGVPRPPERPRRRLLRFDDAGEPGFHVRCSACGFAGWVEAPNVVAVRGIPCPDCYPDEAVMVTIRESAPTEATARDDGWLDDLGLEASR